MSGAIPFTSSGGARVLCEAILYRVFKSCPRTIREESFVTAGRLVDIILPGFAVRQQPWSEWDWLLSMRNSRRRKILVKAWQERKTRGARHKNFARITPFRKTENLPYFGVFMGMVMVAYALYVARLIQAPHDETHLVAGPYLKPLVGTLKEIWHWENWIFYASVNPEKLNKWLRRNRYATSWFWSDYSAYDATYSEFAWDLIESLYRRIYPDAPQEFWEVLEIWRHPVGKAYSRKEGITIDYWGNVCNASGRDDTALANAILNGIVLSLSISAALCGVDISDLQEHHLNYAKDLVQIAVVGDDSLVACSLDIAVYRKEIENNIQSFGLIVKAETSYDLWNVTFLGMMPYPVKGELYWGPTIGRRVYKAFWQAEPKGHLPAWTRGVAQQLAQYRNVPILSDLALRVDHLLAGHLVTKPDNDEYSVWAQIDTEMPQWDDTTLEWVCRRYPLLTPSLMRDDLKTIGQIQRLPAVVHLWTAAVTVAVDDL